MEYQKAQHEMLKLKHKIIPIILQDISKVSKIDRNLKSILGAVTYLSWPGEENEKKAAYFWKQLELSLPKKKPVQNNFISMSSTSSKSSGYSSASLARSLNSSSTINGERRHLWSKCDNLYKSKLKDKILKEHEGAPNTIQLRSFTDLNSASHNITDSYMTKMDNVKIDIDTFVNVDF